VNTRFTVGTPTLTALALALLTVWFLWDLFFAGVNLLTLDTGMPWWLVAPLLLLSLLYSLYRYRRYRERGY
jgi:hypothetical protein